MAKGSTLQLGALMFRTHHEALLHIRAILQAYSPGQRVNVDDSEILRALLARHPQTCEKVGVGIDYFMVRSADYGTQCFWVVRLDGSTVRFSYKECLKVG